MNSDSSHAAAAATGTHDVAVTGATGLVGAALVESLVKSGSKVLRVTRNEHAVSNDTAAWDPQRGFAAPEQLNGLQGVVHLAGESIAAGRWSDAKKRRIRDSRVQGTATLARTLASLEQPDVLVCASAIGFYGDRGDELLDESSAAGTGFLPDVCREWEGRPSRRRRPGSAWCMRGSG